MMAADINLHCDDDFQHHVSARLRAFDQRSAAQEEARAAAVAVTVTDAALGSDLPGMPRYQQPHPGAALILTRRSSRLRNHAGQWAFPGGRLDDGETPEQTALREMEEEIGLKVAPERIVGRLDDFVTRSGFVITPVVIWGGPIATFSPNPDEVESVHRIPVEEFMRADAPILDHDNEGPDPVLRMPVGNDWIAAPTAAIIYQFREVCVLGKSTRVAHYDQPKFAWS